MVSREAISKIFDEILNIRNKCHYSIAEMHDKLNNMSKDEIIDALLEGGWLNDSEEEAYSNLLDKWEKVEDVDYDNAPPMLKKAIDELREQMFYFEKKIFTHERTEIPEVNDDEYLVDNQDTNRYALNELEQKMADAQTSFFNGVDWDEHSVATEFFGDMYWDVNGSMYGGDDYWKEVESETTADNVQFLKSRVNQIVKHMDYLIKNAPSLDNNVKLFRGGIMDTTIPVGGKGKFKSYTSTSYREGVAESFRQDGEYLITIYAPKGTKGIMGNARQSNNENASTLGHPKEHEFLLGKNQEYIVLERNDRSTPPTATIILV